MRWTREQHLRPVHRVGVANTLTLIRTHSWLSAPSPLAQLQAVPARGVARSLRNVDACEATSFQGQLFPITHFRTTAACTERFRNFSKATRSSWCYPAEASVRRRGGNTKDFWNSIARCRSVTVAS